ncbi:protein lin-7-like protein B [Platysternon megacephalum]|uniref:Protein lin-7-like protein B n=1 Tax=Platysternon megacephalum TaxID=55544 RepID=A0A4D9DTG0_9SAUR|nr:protein lin-7-like protein B [Platysternon megacephalum]
MALLEKIAADTVDVKATMPTVPLTVTSINSSLYALTGMVNEAEGIISLVEDQLQGFSALTDLSSLQSKVADLKGWSCPNNLRFRPEGADQDSPLEFIPGSYQKCLACGVACQSQGKNSHLASIHSAEENDFIFHLMGKPLNHTKGQAYWIGAHDTFKEGSFMWTDGSKYNFRTFPPDQPDGLPGENYLGSWILQNGFVTWNDYDASWSFPFVCKYTLRNSLCAIQLLQLAPANHGDGSMHFTCKSRLGNASKGCKEPTGSSS